MQTHLTAGLGLKPEHYEAALDCDRAGPADGLWFEVHPENYMTAGGPRLRWLEAIRARHPVALHGVSLSLAADADPDPAQLARLKALADRIEPALVSEHLAWSAWRGACFPDLLPVPRNNESLHRLCANVSRLQDALGRRVAIENPSHYLRFEAHAWDEIDFLAELARRTGCGLLVDMNNVHVGACNLDYSSTAWVDAVPADAVMEIHLAGHSPDPQLGAALLIDSHNAPVCAEVWALYERLIARIGPRPTLIERDDRLPAYAELMAERARAAAVLRKPLARAA